MRTKRYLAGLTAALLLVGTLAGCGAGSAAPGSSTPLQAAPDTALQGLTSDKAVPTPDITGAVEVVLADDGVTVNGSPADSDTDAAVYLARDIVYYEAGHDFTYGEGTEADAHTADEADAHTVVHIARPGVYRLSGSLSAGQIAVDLGEDAEKDPDAVVTLVLDNVDITCTVAPAVIFYNVYECGSDDADTAQKEVDTAAAGANVVIADGSVNNIAGAYVARIYKSVELNDAGTEVVDSKKLHKYDAAFYSKMSMNLFGGDAGTGVLNIDAENEGLDSELHLTLNGGVINIRSGNDGINTNEDEVSVTTVNGGAVDIVVTGETGEGDGIDSNGWLVINGGMVTASACGHSGDAGIDSDMGIWLNGGVVAASGNMLDAIAGGEATRAVFQFAQQQPGGSVYTLKNAAGEIAAQASPENAFSILVLAAPGMAEGDYTLWCDGTQLAGAVGMNGFGGRGGFGGQRPDGMEMERPEGTVPPEGEAPDFAHLPQNGEMPDLEPLPQDGEMPEKMQRPEGGTPPERPEGEMPQGGFGGDRGEMPGGTQSTTFTLQAGDNRFANVAPAE